MASTKTGTETDSITVKSYHKITGVRQEKVETLTLNHKQWLLKGRAYDSKVLTALYPPFDKRFGYELWKIWASSMQKRLDRYMSQYTKPVGLGKGIPGPAYPTGQTIQPYKPPVRKTAKTPAATTLVAKKPAATTLVAKKPATRRSRRVAVKKKKPPPIATAIPIYDLDEKVYDVFVKAGVTTSIARDTIRDMLRLSLIHI